MSNGGSTDIYGSVNRLIENGCEMALKVVSTGDKNSLLEAIQLLESAHHKMRMAEIDRVLKTETETE